MKKSEVKAWLDSHDIDCRTISLCVADPDVDAEDVADNEDVDPEFGTCDISGIRGNVYWCCAAVKGDDSVYHFQAGDWLIGGHLGRIAGAF